MNKGGRPAKIPVVKQQLRHAILRGELTANQQLAGYREVASSLGVSALTAKRAIDALVAEGWLTSRPGIGTFVRDGRTSTPIALTASRRGGFEAFLSADTLDRFHKSHPHVRIVLSSEPDTDIISTDSYSIVVDRLTQQSLESIDALSARFKHRRWKLPRRLRNMASSDGELYGLPLRLDFSAIQINPSLLQQAGIEIPRRFMDRATFEAILQRCRADRDDDGVVECFGTFHRLWLHEWLVPFWQRGGRLDDESAFFSKKAIAVLDDLWRWYHEENILPRETALGDNERAHDYDRERFESDKIAMRWINGMQYFEPMPFYAPILLPQFGPVRKVPAHAIILAIHRNCPHPDVALQFLDFCYDTFIQGNQAYPIALLEEDKRFLSEEPGLGALLKEALQHAYEPLQEGIPQRTWAIEKQIYRWYRLLQNRRQTMANIREFWQRDWSGHVELPKNASFGAADYRLPPAEAIMERSPP